MMQTIHFWGTPMAMESPPETPPPALDLPIRAAGSSCRHVGGAWDRVRPAGSVENLMGIRGKFREMIGSYWDLRGWPEVSESQGFSGKSLLGRCLG